MVTLAAIDQHEAMAVRRWRPGRVRSPDGPMATLAIVDGRVVGAGAGGSP
jgi:hypothetical protein